MVFGDIRDIFGVLFWKIQILWPSEPFGPKNSFYEKMSDRTFAFSAHDISYQREKVKCLIIVLYNV